MDAIMDHIAALPFAAMVPVLIVMVLVWFAPTLIAMFRNRANLGKIAAVNVPAGMSFVAWGALLVWAISGKGTQDMPAALQNTSINWGWAFAGLILLIVAVSLVAGKWW